MTSRHGLQIQESTRKCDMDIGAKAERKKDLIKSMGF